ncbi:hypothetical protein MMC26_002783 [Xylographa opegraphella]|nr:hypothetical protein [Xylographa opegraphella]
MHPGLLDLPQELTRKIMKYLFGYRHTIHISPDLEADYTMGSILEDDEPAVENLNPEILRVCSQLRDSGANVLYGSHTFEFMSIDSFRWFLSRSDTTEIRRIRLLLDEELSDTIEWIRFWKSQEFKNALPLLQVVEVNTPYAPFTQERQYWFHVRLDVACEVLERETPPNCKVTKKYAQ